MSRRHSSWQRKPSLPRTWSGSTTPTFLTDSAPTPVAQRLADGTLTTGDQFLVDNNGKLALYVKNGATEADFVFDRTFSGDGADLPDRTDTVPANSERILRDFDPKWYGDTLKFAIDDVSNVTVAVLRLP